MSYCVGLKKLKIEEKFYLDLIKLINKNKNYYLRSCNIFFINIIH